MQLPQQYAMEKSSRECFGGVLIYEPFSVRFYKYSKTPCGPTITTTYSIEASGTNGCGAGTVLVTVIPLPVISVNPSTICFGSISQRASGGLSYYGALRQVDFTNIPNPQTSPSTTTTYTVTVINSNGCETQIQGCCKSIPIISISPGIAICKLTPN
jgi:hypothetical protein